MSRDKQPLLHRTSLAGWMICGLFVLCVYSQARIQVVDRDATLKLAAKSNRLSVARKEYAMRGAIISSDGIALAESDDTYSLSLDYRKIPLSDAFFIDLSEAAGIPTSEIKQPALKGFKGRVWRSNFGPAKCAEITKIRSKWRADGVSINRVLGRRYALDAAGSTLIGITRDGSGSLGLESTENETLAGQNGLREGLIDRSGAFLPMRMNDTSIPKIDGKDIHLTIDSGLQEEAFRSVRQAVESNKADSGVAIVIEPATGNLLAMASWPAFDPTLSRIPEGSERNDCVMSAFEPGSTFKILTLAKALDAGVVDPTSHLQCSGVLNYNSSWRIRCDLHHGSRAHGDCNLEKAIAKSCNVSAATWALKLGHPTFVQYMNDLGLLKPTGIELPGETSGSYVRGEYAKPLQLMTFGFGQSLTATPLQLAAAFAMLGNDGMRAQPRLITRIGDEEVSTKPPTQIIKKETADGVLKLMESVIESDSGTGAKLRIPGYHLAGKTGTAQKVNKGGKGGHVSSFVGFVPSEKPKALIMVMIDRPQAGKIYGAQVAGPVFREVALEVIRRFRIPPSAPRTQSQQ